MGSVVHSEIIGNDPARLRGYYGELLGWEFRTADAVTEKVSQPGMYGFVDGSTTGEGNGINGDPPGVGSGGDQLELPRRGENAHPRRTVCRSEVHPIRDVSGQEM